MILLVATNPSIDRNCYLPQLTAHQVHRSKRLHITAGGKAINVARALQNLGCNGTIAGFLGGHSGQLLSDLVAQEGLKAQWYNLSFSGPSETKMSYLLQHADGDATVINEPGPTLDARDWQAFSDHIKTLAQGCSAVVLAGSIPPGVTPKGYLQLCQELTWLTDNVYIDTPGASLEAITQNPQGFNIKVNLSELSEALKIDLSLPGQLHAALRSLIGAGAKSVGVTLGAKGAALANVNGAWCTSPVPVQRVSTVGCGDSFTAGLVWAQAKGLSIREALIIASASGAANSETPYPAIFSAARVEELKTNIKVEPL